jgi:bifunctional non-homologous end joining protein LigD
MDDQLSLPLGHADDPAVFELPRRLALRTATDAGRPFDDDSFFFEPWWPGTHAYLRRHGRRVELHVEHLSDPLVTFPELAADLARLDADGLIVEGTLLALDADGRPDVALLRRRLRGDRGPAAEGAFVASDLVYLEGRSLARKPFAERRRMLLASVHDTDHRVVGRGLSGEGVTLGRAAASLGIRAISARRLDRGWKTGVAGDAWLRLGVTEVSAEPTRPLLVLLEKLPLDA